MSKNILYISPKIPFPPNDGHTKSMYGFIKSTHELGYKNDLVCYTQNKNHEAELNKVCNPFYIDVKTVNNLFKSVLNLFSTVPYNLSKYKRKELIKFLEKHLIKNDYDFIIIFNAHMGWIVDYLKTKTNSKIVLREENLELSIMEKYFENQKNIFLKFYAWIQFKKFLKYEPKLCEKFDACFMISEQDKERLLFLNNKINAIVINSGVDNVLFRLKKINVDKYSLIHIGSLNWYPNLDGIRWFLDEIFPKVLIKEPNVKLYIYGSKLPQSFHLKEEIKNSIINIGYVENLWEEISNKFISVVPLRIGSGIRIKILELIASENIVVSTSLGAEGTGLKNQKHIFIADNSDEFANTILRLINEKYDFNKLIKESKKYVLENFSWNTISQKIDEELRKLT